MTRLRTRNTSFVRLNITIFSQVQRIASWINGLVRIDTRKLSPFTTPLSFCLAASSANKLVDNASPMSNNTASFNLEKNILDETPRFDPIAQDEEDDAAERALEEALEELSRIKFLRDTSMPQAVEEDKPSPREDTINNLYDTYAEEKTAKTPRARLIAAAARTRLHSPGRVLQESPTKPTTPERVNSQRDSSTRSSPVPNVDFVPTRSQRPLTVPKEFNLSSPKIRSDRPIDRTDSLEDRRRNELEEFEERPAPRRVEARPLRSVSIKSNAPRPLTVPKPFAFHTTSRPRIQDQLDAPSPYVPLAVRVQQFQKTPARFKTRQSAFPEKVCVSKHAMRS